jgi:hypothetical protein
MMHTSPCAHVPHPCMTRGMVRSRMNVPARAAACSACVDTVFPRMCPVRGDCTVVSHPPVPLGACHRAGMCARACVTWAGGVLTGRAWSVQNAQGVDSVRRRQVAAPSGPSRSPMPRLPPAPQPAQAIACCSAFRSSTPEAGRGPLLSGTAACSAVTVLPKSTQLLTCHTTRLLDGTRAITLAADQRTKRHAAHTLNQRCAASIVQTTRRIALRGTHRYSTGTQQYSAAGWHVCIHTEQAPCTVRHA